MALGCMTLTVIQVSAQGTIRFGNDIPGVINAPIFGEEYSASGDWANARSGNTLAGYPPGGTAYSGRLLEGYYVGFWATPVVGESNGRWLVPADVVVKLGTGSDAGYFPTTNVTFAFLPASGQATVQVRVWRESLGANPYDWDAYAGTIVGAGASDLFVADIGGVADKFRSFNLGYLSDNLTPTLIPEPRGLALLALAFFGYARKRGALW